MTLCTIQSSTFDAANQLAELRRRSRVEQRALRVRTQDFELRAQLDARVLASLRAGMHRGIIMSGRNRRFMG